MLGIGTAWWVGKKICKIRFDSTAAIRALSSELVDINQNYKNLGELVYEIVESVSHLASYVRTINSCKCANNPGQGQGNNIDYKDVAIDAFQNHIDFLDKDIQTLDMGQSSLLADRHVKLHLGGLFHTEIFSNAHAHLTQTRQ